MPDAFQSRRPRTRNPLSATPKRNDCAQSQAAWNPIAHHSEPVRQRVRQKDESDQVPRRGDLLGDSPGFPA